MADAVAVDELAQAEKAKYTKMWEHQSYRERSPGKRFLHQAMFHLQMSGRSSVVDLGCGTGRVAEELRSRGLEVTAVDIAANACTEFDGPFVEACLWDLPESLGRHDYGFCADVMEHVPTERVSQCLASIAKHCGTVYFQIANFVCHEGDKIGEHLHLTVKPLHWWVVALEQHYSVQVAEPWPKHHVFVCKSLAF